jgi:uncharacterized membrane protein YdjX (TVP38/TMEM64 family)
LKHPRPPPRRRKRSGYLRISIFAVAIVVVTLLYAAGGHRLLSVASLQQHRDALLQLQSRHHWEVLGIVVLTSISLVAVSVPVSGLFMLICGVLYGRIGGTLLVDLCASLGAVLALLIVRYFAEDFVRARLRGHPRARKLLSGLDRNRDHYLLFLRVAPGIPFWLTNIMTGLTDMPAWRFLLLTLAGLIPDCFIYCNIGANLAELRSTHDLISPRNIAILLLLAVLCLAPVLLHELKRRRLVSHGWPFRRA